MNTNLVQDKKNSSNKSVVGDFLSRQEFGYGANNSVSDKHIYAKGGGCCCCCCCCCCSAGAADVEE